VHSPPPCSRERCCGLRCAFHRCPVEDPSVKCANCGLSLDDTRLRRWPDDARSAKRGNEPTGLARVYGRSLAPCMTSLDLADLERTPRANFWRRRAGAQDATSRDSPGHHARMDAQGATPLHEGCGQSGHIQIVRSATCQLSPVTASGSNRQASSRHANAPRTPRRAHTSLGGGRLVRVCRRISGWLGLLRFRAVLPVRLRHKKTGITLAESLTLASRCQGQSRLAAHERAMARKPARSLTGFPMG
jgi:hypothetical protein